MGSISILLRLRFTTKAGPYIFRLDTKHPDPDIAEAWCNPGESTCVGTTLRIDESGTVYYTYSNDGTNPPNPTLGTLGTVTTKVEATQARDIANFPLRWDLKTPFILKFFTYDLVENRWGYENNPVIVKLCYSESKMSVPTAGGGWTSVTISRDYKLCSP